MEGLIEKLTKLTLEFETQNPDGVLESVKNIYEPLGFTIAFNRFAVHDTDLVRYVRLKITLVKPSKFSPYG